MDPVELVADTAWAAATADGQAEDLPAVFQVSELELESESVEEYGRAQAEGTLVDPRAEFLSFRLQFLEPVDKTHEETRDNQTLGHNKGSHDRLPFKFQAA